MKRTVLIVALAALGFTGCSKEESKPTAAPAVPITSAPATAPAAADAAKDAAKTSTEMPKAETAKNEASKNAKK